MRRVSAHYVYTNSGPPLKRPIICTEEDGTIISIEATSGELNERHSVEFYNGLIIPGFVNCHCHTELSWMKGKISTGTGLGGFLTNLNSVRNSLPENIMQPAIEADSKMAREGVVLCADICNSPLTFGIKKKSIIKYLNLLEVYGIDPEKAEKRLKEIMEVASVAEDEKLAWQIVPHSVYSVSVPLLRLILEKTRSNSTTSVHFLETEEEAIMLSDRKGSLMDAYKKLLSPSSEMNIVKDHSSAILEEITPSGNILLVHNTFISREVINNLRKRNNIFYCLCPNSNIYIEGRIAPAALLAEEKCNIVIGTDSLASNESLSIISELKTLQAYFPLISLEELIRWATINGAMALGEDKIIGSIEPGKKPGLVLIENADLKNMRLLPKSIARRLI